LERAGGGGSELMGTIQVEGRAAAGPGGRECGALRSRVDTGRAIPESGKVLELQPYSLRAVSPSRSVVLYSVVHHLHRSLPNFRAGARCLYSLTPRGTAAPVCSRRGAAALAS